MRRLLSSGDDKPRIIDLLFHLPTGFVDRRNQPKLSEVPPDTVVTVAVTVEGHRPPPPNRPRAPYNIDASDDTNTLTITYFNTRRDHLEKLFPEGETRYVSGTTTLYDGHLQMIHPDRVVDAAGFAKLPLIDPVYPLTEGLHPNQVRRAIEAALDRVPENACPNGRMPTGYAQRLRELRAMRCAASIVRRRPTTSSRRVLRGRGLRMTNCLPGSSRSRSCARISARGPDVAPPPKGGCARASSRRCPIR